MWGLSAVTIYLFAFPALLLVLKGTPKYKANEIKKLSVSKFLMYFVIALGTMYICNYITILINFILGWIKGSPIINPLESIVGTNVIANIIFGGLLAPIMEEVIFRGALINRLRKYGDVICIFVSAFAFGLIHGNLSQLFYAFGVGIVFAYITLKTGTIKYSIILHIVINLLGIVVVPYLASTKNMIFMAIVGLIVMGLIVLAIILFVLNMRNIKLDKGEVQIKGSKKIKMFIFNFGTITFMVLNVVLIVLVSLR